MSRHGVFALLALFVPVLYACSQAPPPRYEITYTDPLFNQHEAFAEGFALAPVDQAEPGVGGAEALAQMTNELYTALLTFTEKAEIVDPKVVLERAKEQGEETETFLRSFQRDRINGVALNAEDCKKILEWLDERFFFVSWVEERTEVGMRERPTVDYTDIEFSQDIYAVTYQKFEGSLSGALIDLVRGVIVWKGVARYTTGEMYKDNLPADLWTQRNRACVAMARLLSLD